MNRDSETIIHCFKKNALLLLLSDFVTTVVGMVASSLGCDLGRIPIFNAKEDINTSKDNGLAAPPKVAKELKTVSNGPPMNRLRIGVHSAKRRPILVPMTGGGKSGFSF